MSVSEKDSGPRSLFGRKRSGHGLRLAFALAIVVWGGARWEASADPYYQITDLGTLSSLDDATSYAEAVNLYDQVAGYCIAQPSSYRAFLWDAGTMTELGTLPGRIDSLATDINDGGQVVGYSLNYPSDQRAFLWEDGSMTDLGTLGGAESWAFGINGGGQVVGYSTTEGGAQHAFVWDSVGGMQDIGTLGGSQSYATGVNDSGQVVGFSQTVSGAEHAFLWDSGTMTDLGTLGFDSRAWAMNNSGHVVGYSHFGTGSLDYRAFLWRDGVMTDLGTLAGGRSRAYDINDAGQVVGFSSSAAAGMEPFLWQDGVMVDAKDLLVPGSVFVPYQAHAINELGHIAGYGRVPGGDIHGFLMTPEPASCVLALLGLGFGGLYARRRRKSR